MQIISILITLIGAIIVITGAFFKIMHWPGSDIMIIAGLITFVIGIVLLISTRKK